MPKLSIIIPTFNSAKTMERCLRSVESQTFNDLEVLIQDGGSTDDTIEIVEEYRSRNSLIQISIKSVEDRGTYDAMNKGMRRARGEWLYFLGSDDELFDERVLDAVMTGANTAGCDLIYGNVEVVGDCGWARSGSIYDGQFSLVKLLNKNICHQAVLYRTEFARRVGEYNVRYPLSADWDFNLRCWAQTRSRYVELTIARFHAGGVSTTGVGDEQFSRDLVVNAMRYFNLSLFDPLINSRSFYHLSEVIEMQRAKGKLHSLSGRALRFLLRVQERFSIGRGRRSVS